MLPLYDSVVPSQYFLKLHEIRYCPFEKNATFDTNLVDVKPALALYERDACNFLVPHQVESFAPILSVSEVATLWHLPNELCQVQGIQWRIVQKLHLSPFTREDERLTAKKIYNRTILVEKRQYPVIKSIYIPRT